MQKLYVGWCQIEKAEFMLQKRVKKTNMFKIKHVGNISNFLSKR